jgi:hypothetical protein
MSVRAVRQTKLKSDPWPASAFNFSSLVLDAELIDTAALVGIAERLFGAGRLGQPHAAAGAAISLEVRQACSRRVPRQTQRPRTDRTSRLQDVVLADRSHQVS